MRLMLPLLAACAMPYSDGLARSIHATSELWSSLGPGGAPNFQVRSLTPSENTVHCVAAADPGDILVRVPLRRVVTSADGRATFLGAAAATLSETTRTDLLACFLLEAAVAAAGEEGAESLRRLLSLDGDDEWEGGGDAGDAGDAGEDGRARISAPDALAEGPGGLAPSAPPRRGRSLRPGCGDDLLVASLPSAQDLTHVPALWPPGKCKKRATFR